MAHTLLNRLNKGNRMKNVIELKEIDIPSGDFWNYANYPEDGIYNINGDTYGNYYVRANNSVIAFYRVHVDSIPDTPPATPLEDILKVIAISQNPELITKLIK